MQDSYRVHTTKTSIQRFVEEPKLLKKKDQNWRNKKKKNAEDDKTSTEILKYGPETLILVWSVLLPMHQLKIKMTK